jgi:hypothetical protein
MASRKPGSERARRIRPDGRRSLLVYLRPEVIRELKKAALDYDRTAYEITEEAVAAWLAARKTGQKDKGG